MVHLYSTISITCMRLLLLSIARVLSSRWVRSAMPALVSLFLYFLDTEKAGRRTPSPRFGLCLSTFFFVLYSLVFLDLVVFPLVEFCREQGQLTYFCVSARSRFGLSPPPSELKPGEGGGSRETEFR